MDTAPQTTSSPDVIKPHPAFRRSARASGLEISEIVRISERARTLRAEGRDIIALSTGEPDFPTPAHVTEAAHAAALAGDTRYTATAGTPALRAALAEQAHRTPAEVIVSTGAKQVLANAMLATLDPGDEVVIPAPYWTTYSDTVALAGGTPVILPCTMQDGFKLTPEALAGAITPRTRWLMLNSPSNPSGAVYTAAEYRALADVLAHHPHVWLITDEIYRHLTYTAFTRFTDAAPHLADRTLVVDGVSKAYAMTGWRIGWGIGPEPLIAAMAAVQGQVTSGACSIAQAAARAAVTGPQDLLDDRRAILKARRDQTAARLNALGFDCPLPDGAFYLFPSAHRLIAAGGHADDAAFCAWLLDTAGVALVPGRAFGLPGHLRLSFAYAQTDLDAGLDRIETALTDAHAVPT